MDILEYIGENKEKAHKHLQNTFIFDEMDEDDIFYHMCFCLLVPGGRADKTRHVIDSLRQWDFLYDEIPKDDLLKLFTPNIRFPQQKLERLQKLKNKSWDIIETIKEFINRLYPAIEVRDYLVKSIDGFGYKAASHFMRNIGFQSIAIIDTHILKHRHSFLPEKYVSYIPRSRISYLLIESYFIEWAKELNISPVCLDWLIWCKEGGYDINSFVM